MRHRTILRSRVLLLLLSNYGLSCLHPLYLRLFGLQGDLDGFDHLLEDFDLAGLLLQLLMELCLRISFEFLHAEFKDTKLCRELLILLY